jgi:hypothetical protein
VNDAVRAIQILGDQTRRQAVFGGIGAAHHFFLALCGGKRLSGEAFDNGAWVEPTVFTDCRDEMTIVRMTRCARFRSWVTRPAARPYSVALARRTTSSSLS